MPVPTNKTIDEYLLKLIVKSKNFMKRLNLTKYNREKPSPIFCLNKCTIKRLKTHSLDSTAAQIYQLQTVCFCVTSCVNDNERHSWKYCGWSRNNITPLYNIFLCAKYDIQNCCIPLTYLRKILWSYWNHCRWRPKNNIIFCRNGNRCQKQIVFVEKHWSKEISQDNSTLIRREGILKNEEPILSRFALLNPGILLFV